MKSYLTHNNVLISQLPPDTIFVFGSNREGIHRSGAARTALDCFGAILGQGEGLQNQCYALPTKYTPWHSCILVDLKAHIETFLTFAESRPDLKFFVTPFGTGLAGYTHEEIVGLIDRIPANCIFWDHWINIMRDQGKI